MQARMITKAGCAIAALFAVIPVFAAGSIKWIGPDGGDYYDVNNWQGGVLPGADDTIVFNPGDGVTLVVTNELTAAAYTASPTGIKFAGVKVLSGTVKLLGPYANDNSDSKGSYFRLANDITNEWYVAEGSVFRTSHRPQPTTSGKGILMKTGGGTVQFDNFNWSNNSSGYRMESTIVEEGVIQVTRRYGFRSHHYYVRNGATFTARQYSYLQHYEVFHIDGGGLVELSETASQYAISGLEGGGELHVYSASGDPRVELNLNGGPYTNFTGKIVKKGGAPSFRNYAASSSFKANEDARHFWICSSNTFVNFSAFMASIQPEFAGGIGTFYLPPIVASPGVVYNTEDVDGNPIELHADFCTSSTYLNINRSSDNSVVTTGNFARVIGPGSWYPIGDNTITGGMVQVTGKVVVPSGKKLYFGRQTNALEDVAAYPFSLENRGTVYFRNVASATLDNSVDNLGTVNVYGPVAFSKFQSVGTLSIDGTKGGVATLTGDSEVVQTDLVFSNDAKLILDGPGVSVHRAEDVAVNANNPYRTTLKDPGGVKVSSGSTNSLLEVRNGAVCHCGYSGDAVMPPVRVLDGGRMVIHRGGGWMGPANGVYEIFADGGHFEVGTEIGSYAVSMFDSSTCDHLLMKVGAKGVVFDSRATKTGRYASSLQLNCYLPIESGTGVGVPDGGVTVETGNVFMPMRCWNLQGPITLGDARFEFGKTLVDRSPTAEPFGTSDFVMKPGAWMAFGDKASEYSARIAGREGGRMLLNGHARIDVQDPSFSNRTQPFTLNIGKAGAASSSLAANEYGALTLTRINNSSSVCDNFRVKVEGGVETYADGRTKIPVFCWRDGGVDFATYDNDAGITNFTGYVNNFNGGAGSTVLVNKGDKFTLESGTTEIGALCVKMDGSKTSQITIPADSTLKIGNGTDTAVLLCQATGSNQSYIPFAGAGAIDFGNSKGMITSPRRSNSTYTRYIRLTNRITGNNGLVYSGVNNSDCADDNTSNNAHFQLETENDYAGDTVVDMANVNASHKDCFSSGAVTVHGSRLGGGNVNFRCEGPFANDFTISRYGRRYNVNNGVTYGWENVSWGALSFGVAGTRITGDVTVDGQSRISSYFPEAGSEVVVFEGEVKGGLLEIVDHSPAKPHRYVFTQDNHSLTGGVEVLNGATAVLRGANPTLGTGRIALANGTIRFENTGDYTATNKLYGTGVIALGSEKEVLFRGDYSELEATIDLCGMRHEFSELPPFPVTNSVGRATIAIRGGLGTIPFDVELCGPALGYDLEIGEGTQLDLGGETLTVRRLLKGGRTQINGEIVELKPRRGTILMVR